MSKRFLCFDYGTKKIGIAVGQTFSKTATPLEVVSFETLRTSTLTTLLAHWKPDGLVVGWPEGAHDKILNERILPFKRWLEKTTALPVFLEDERYSSQSANTYIKQGAGAGKDAIAAAVILESFLHQQPD